MGGAMGAGVQAIDVTPFLDIVDKDLPQPQQYNYEVTRDSIRHYAHAVDDYNALYLDHDFARASAWNSIIAPPGYLSSHGSSSWLARHFPDVRDAAGNALSAVTHAADEWAFERPVRPGDVVISHSKVAQAELKNGRSVGPSIRLRLRTRYWNQRGEDVAVRTGTYFVLNKATAGKSSAAGYPPLPAGKSRNVILPTRFPGTFDMPPPRRDAQRYFEDVQIGEAVTPLHLGPLMLQHLGRFCAATHGTGADEVGGPSENGAIPDAYVFGHMRIPWFGTLLTRWGGPATWITSLSQMNRSWLLIGFKVVCRGTVSAKSACADEPWIDLELTCENELGHRTNTGLARLRLPSRSARH